MNRKRSKFFSGLGAIVLTLAMLITMLPVTEAWADMTDYTAPVIESVSIKEAGQEIIMGESITLEMVAYDQDSSLDMVTVSAHCGNHSIGAAVGEVANHADGNNHYTIKVPINFLVEGEWTIDYVRVHDTAHLYTDYAINQTITVKRKVVEGSVATVTFDKETYERTEENLLPNVIYTVNISGIDASPSGINADFAKKDGTSAYSGLAAMNKGANTFEGRWEINDKQNSEYALKSVYYLDENGIKNYIETVNENSFSYVNKVTDNAIPTLTGISVDKQGEFVESGEVTITITAKDEHKINETGTLMLYTPISNISPYSVELKKVSSNDAGTEVTMQGKVDVANLSACEWYVSGVLISDILGNGGYAYGSDIDTTNYYFYVNKEGFVDKTYNNVTIRLRDNSYNVYASVTGTIPRRVKLGDVFGDKWVTTLPADDELGAFVGWQYNEQLLTKDTVIQIEHDYTSIDIVPKYEKQKINVSYMYLSGKYANYRNEEIITEKVLTYGEIMDMVKCPVNSGYTFSGWDEEGIDKDAYVTSDYISLRATYDKYPVELHIAYLDENGVLKVVDEIKDYAAGTTFAQILKGYNSNVTQWIYSDMNWKDLDDIVVDINNLVVEANAAYADKQIVQYNYNWIGDSDESEDYGEYVYNLGYIVVDKEVALSKDALAKNVKQTVIADYFDKLTCSRITTNVSDYDNDGYADEVYLYSEYDNILVNLYAYDPETDELLFDQYYAVEPGETFYLPKEYNGEKVYWCNEEDYEYYTGSFKVPEDIENGWNFWFFIETELPEDAIIHENESLPSKPSDPVTPPTTPEEDKPVVEMDKEVVEDTTNKIEEAIKEAEKNVSATEEAKPVQVVVDMKKEDGTVATEVPKEILEAAKGQNVEVVLDMGDYSWTINGKDIKATNLKDINLEVELNTNNIPSATVEKIANGQETHQLSLTHNGDFGFKANLTINLGKEKEGKYGNLYYYDSDGKLVFMNAGKIDADGNVSLAFSHASEYVVVISDKAVEVPKTGDNTNGAMYLAILFAGAMFTVLSLKKKRVI